MSCLKSALGTQLENQVPVRSKCSFSLRFLVSNICSGYCFTCDSHTADMVSGAVIDVNWTAVLLGKLEGKSLLNLIPWRYQRLQTTWYCHQLRLRRSSNLAIQKLSHVTCMSGNMFWLMAFQDATSYPWCQLYTHEQFKMTYGLQHAVVKGPALAMYVGAVTLNRLSNSGKSPIG